MRLTKKAMRAAVASIVTAVIIRVIGAVFFAYDVDTNMDASQWEALKSMPYAAADNFIKTHSIPASMWERLGHAFYWKDLYPGFLLMLIAIFLSSLALQYWPTERK